MAQIISHLSLLLGLLHITGVFADQNHTSQTRIIGGYEVWPNSIPYQASLQYKNYLYASWEHSCGGTLIHPQWVLSAAHCYQWGELFRVVLGEHSFSSVEGYEQEFQMSRVFVHRMYNFRTMDNDIMLIKLDRPAILSNRVQVASLPYTNTRRLTASTKCRASGWGQTEVSDAPAPPELRAVVVNFSPRCGSWNYFQITRNMICAGRFGGACFGDSGGPLVCNGNLEGIVSWGRADTCVSPYFPGVYTEVRNYRRWINWYLQHV